MKIEDRTIFFKSSPEFFQKELRGIKNNTVRTLDGKDGMVLSKNIGNLDFICITSTTTGLSFIRSLRDISFYADRWIFTWDELI